MIRTPKVSNLPAKGLWAPGKSRLSCPRCGDEYLGASDAHECGDCAWDEPPLGPEESPPEVEKPRFDYAEALIDDAGYVDFSKPQTPTDAKAVAGAEKISFSTVPPIANLYCAAAMHYGAGKYGAHNWRDKDIVLRAYIDPLKRHMELFAAGVDIDREVTGSGLPHLAHIMATCAILLDAMKAGRVVDDRAVTPSYEETVAEIGELMKEWPKRAA